MNHCYHHNCHMQVYDNQCIISAGEIKSSGRAYGDAVKQLVERLSLLRWAATVVHGVESVILAGHVYIPRQQVGLQPRSEKRDGVFMQLHAL